MDAECTHCKGLGKLRSTKYTLTFEGLQEDITPCTICYGTGLRSEQEKF